MTTSATALPENSVPEVRNGSRQLFSMSMHRKNTVIIPVTLCHPRLHRSS